MKKECFEIRDVLVGYHKGVGVMIHTVICDDNSHAPGVKPTLVLVHGYGGSGALFYKILK